MDRGTSNWAPEGVLVAWCLWLGWAAAGPLNFVPDRARLGGSPEGVGGGHVMVEGGLRTGLASPPTVAIEELRVRAGIADILELQLATLRIDLGAPVTPGATLAVKLGGRLSDHFSLAGTYQSSFGSYYGAQWVEPWFVPDLGLTGGWSDDRFAVWAHAGLTWLVSRVGAGASVALGPAGLYVQAATRGDAVHPLEVGYGQVGGGVTVRPTDAFQIDAGVEVYTVRVPAVVKLGASVAI